MSNYPIKFVGAGPGDPDLITVKGQKALMEADLVIYAGSLVPEAVLKWVDSNKETLNSAALDLEQILAKMKQAHEKGLKVVRLHTGDPSLYGAIAEQMEQLDLARIPYEVIPGVTAAFAAAAAMAMEYTLPEVTQTLILTRMAGRTPVPEKEALKTLAKHQASMAIYLSISMIDSVSRILIDAYGEDTLCAVAFKVSQPEEKIMVIPLYDLSRAVAENNITHQALIIVSHAIKAQSQQIVHKSKLYDKTFTHGYRQAQE